MKHILIILLLVSTGLVAQNDRKERIRALKTAFITERLDLSSAEAEKFWPVYNHHEGKMQDLRKKERLDNSILRTGIDTMSEAEATELIAKSIEYKEAEIQHRKKLLQDLAGVISSKKIIRLIKTEKDFTKKLLEHMKQRRKNRK